MAGERPIFGEKEAGADYATRVGVHAVIAREAAAGSTEICLLQTPNGAYYLPGGEIEPGETQETALARELMEELGAVAVLGRYLGCADEYYYSSHRVQHYYNPAHAYAIRAIDFAQEPLEAGNHIVWFPLETAVARLKRGSHQWAIRQWQKTNQAV